MTLPGTGVKRFRDKPRMISDSEKMAALYNTACCHARMGEGREGLLALSGACLCVCGGGEKGGCCLCWGGGKEGRGMALSCLC